MLDKSGTIHWGRIIAQPLIEGEKVTGITGLIGDITELKHSEEALRESEEKLKLAIEGSGVGLWDWRVQSGEMVINDRWAQILGYTVEESLTGNHRYLDLLNPPGRPAKIPGITPEALFRRSCGFRVRITHEAQRRSLGLGTRPRHGNGTG